MNKNDVLLGSYALQKDLRIKLPKQIVSNLSVEVGTVFDIYINPTSNEIILRISDDAISACKDGNDVR